MPQYSKGRPAVRSDASYGTGKEIRRNDRRLGMNSILVINGPNLNMLGVREPEVYGTMDLSEICSNILGACESLGVVVEFFQSNHEGGIIDRIQQAYYDGIDGIVINPGALTHYSYSLRDAIASVPIPFVEVHLSDIHKREGWRSVSVTAEVCVAQVCGQGWEGYVEAIKILNERIAGEDAND